MKTNGFVAAPFTPMHADGRLNLAGIPALAQRLIADGVKGAFVCGTTGEGSSLTSAERKQIAERWRQASAGQLKLFVHVGHTCLADARELAAHAQAIGADAISALAPYFFRPPRPEELVRFCAELAGAAPKLPFYYYHMPAMTGITFGASDFLATATGRIPTLAGIKFTHENLLDLQKSMAFDSGRYEILFGRDEILLAGLSLGCTGAVGSTYNFAGPLYQKILAAYARGDMATAQACQQKSVEFIDIAVRYGGLPALKAIMALIGCDCGPVRLPQRQPAADLISKLEAELKQMGFFSECVATGK